MMRRGNINCLIWKTCIVPLFSCHSTSGAKIARLKKNWGWNVDVKGVIKFQLNFGASSSLWAELGNGWGKRQPGRICESSCSIFFCIIFRNMSKDYGNSDQNGIMSH